MSIAVIAERSALLDAVKLTPRTPLRVTWSTPDRLDDLDLVWEALAEEAIEPNVFYTPAFGRAAAPVFGRGLEVALVWSQDGTRLLGLFPLQWQARRYGVPLAVASLWTHPYAPLGVPLVHREAPDAVIRSFLLALAERKALLLAPMLPLENPFVKALRRALDGLGYPAETFGAHQRAALVTPDAPADYLTRSLGRKRHKELQRQRRRLEDSAPLSLSLASDGPAFTEALEAFLALEVAGWKGRARTATGLHPELRTFMADAVGRLARSGAATILTHTQSKKTVAAGIVLRAQDTAWFWKIAYDESLAKHSPGVQLTLDLTRELLTDTQIARADSCATPDHAMIDHVWRERLAIGDLLIGGGTRALTFRLAVRLERLRRTAMAQARAFRRGLRGR